MARRVDRTKEDTSKTTIDRMEQSIRHVSSFAEPHDSLDGILSAWPSALSVNTMFAVGPGDFAGLNIEASVIGVTGCLLVLTIPSRESEKVSQINAA